jgi:hypothetical protein
MSGIVKVAFGLAAPPDDAVVEALVAAGDAEEPRDAVLEVEPDDDEPEVVVEPDDGVLSLLLPHASSSVPAMPAIPSTPAVRSKPRRLSAFPMSARLIDSPLSGESLDNRVTLVDLLPD